MSDYVIIQKDTLTAMGDAVREYTGETKLYTLDEMYYKLRPYSVQIIEGDIDSSFVLPDGITSVGYRVFQNCTNLALTSLPDSITRIDDYAFHGCSNLALTSLPDGIVSIGEHSFNGCYTLMLTSLPSSVMSIGNYAFNHCSSLTTITFNGTPTTIESTAFYNCPQLRTINVPWSEGEVAGAPWGATNATVNYNYVDINE